MNWLIVGVHDASVLDFNATHRHGSDASALSIPVIHHNAASNTAHPLWV
jgi:hypothetical protein